MTGTVVGVLTLVGVVVSYVIGSWWRSSHDVRLWDLLKPRIHNTAAPTTTELRGFLPCPRCGDLYAPLGRALDGVVRYSCNTCGWVRYPDYMGGLRDAQRQPPWTTGAIGAETRGEV